MIRSFQKWKQTQETQSNVCTDKYSSVCQLESTTKPNYQQAPKLSGGWFSEQLIPVSNHQRLSDVEVQQIDHHDYQRNRHGSLWPKLMSPMPIIRLTNRHKPITHRCSVTSIISNSPAFRIGICWCRYLIQSRCPVHVRQGYGRVPWVAFP